jgi:hypothetical protein
MMIVAGKLLASTPHRNSEYGEEDEFAEWIDGYDLSRNDGRWLWDRRDPTPLERPTWQDREKESAWNVTENDFDEALRSASMLNVWGNWTFADSNREQSVHITSALVSPAKSLALLRALGTIDDIHSYALPSAESDFEIDEIGFSLKGWITDYSRDRALDGQDRWAGGVRFPAPMPASYVVDLMCLQADSDSRLWKDGADSIVMASQIWGHYDEAKRNESSNPERGSRLQARPDFLWVLLSKLGRDLIVEVQIDRRRRYRSYESSIGDDNKQTPRKSRLYLFRADGRHCTLKGPLGFGL